MFQRPILTEEMDEILSQLEDKKPKLILLNSIGGNVLGALRFARYVRQNQMNTWIAENQTCASACALVFLAGIQRFSEGKLVVHQYLPTAGQGDAKVTWDRAFIGVQRVLSNSCITACKTTHVCNDAQNAHPCARNFIRETPNWWL